MLSALAGETQGSSLEQSAKSGHCQQGPGAAIPTWVTWCVEFDAARRADRLCSLESGSEALHRAGHLGGEQAPSREKCARCNLRSPPQTGPPGSLI